VKGTFVPVHGAPKGEKVVHSSLMLTPKFGDNGELTLMKVRLVAAGNEVDPSLYTKEETSSPTVSNLSMMVMLAAGCWLLAAITMRILVRSISGAFSLQPSVIINICG
jgi:hypothetical protein